MDQTWSFWQFVIPKIWKAVVCKDGRKVLFVHSNKLVFKILRHLGFFDFHETNSGAVVATAQVVAFLHYGYKALRNGFKAREGHLEVHHLSGDCSDDRPENLVYLSKQDHLVVSASSNTPRFGKVESCDPTPFNRQGRPINDHKRFLAEIITTTVAAVAKVRTNSVVKIPIPKALLGLPRDLYEREINHLCAPAWHNQLTVLAIFTDDPLACYR